MNLISDWWTSFLKLEKIQDDLRSQVRLQASPTLHSAETDTGRTVCLISEATAVFDMSSETFFL